MPKTFWGRILLVLTLLWAQAALAQTAPGYAQAVAAYQREDFAAALRGFNPLAEQGHAAAQFALGQMHRLGRGVDRDETQAVAWFRKSAAQGVGRAQVQLGMAYLNGRGVARDERQAAEWFRRAAEQGRPAGQAGLSSLYEAGKGGLPKDLQTAYFWALLAEAKGNTWARQAKPRLAQALSAQQRTLAVTAARGWRAKPAAHASAGQDDAFGSDGAEPPAATRAGRPATTGSGFRVAGNSVITNYHVIGRCGAVRVNGIEAKVLAHDARSDLALLGTSASGPTVKLRSQPAAVGEAVAVAGYPLRGLLSGFNMTLGNLSSMTGVRGDPRFMQITAPVQPGNSGGPMLDASGNLMGVVVSKLNAMKMARSTGDIPQNVNFAIQSSVLRTFLDAHGVAYESRSSEQAIAATAIAEKARDFTVLVECWKP